MTGYQSKKAAAQDKLSAAPDVALYEAVSAIYFDDSNDYLPALLAVVRGLSPDIAALLESNPSAAWHQAEAKKNAAIKEALAQPEQERTDYAVHLNHCNIGECQGVCKYLDDDCPALKHADMKAKWDSPATQQPEQEVRKRMMAAQVFSEGANNAF